MKVSLILSLLMIIGASFAQKPNILLIMADDVSIGSIGVYGSKYIQTPNFDKLAEEGVLFKNAYTCNPKCSPSRSSILTGRYSWQLEEACNHNPILSDKFAYYPELLADAGYHVGYTGKGWAPGSYPGQQNPAGQLYQKFNITPPYKGISNKNYSANFKYFLEQNSDDKPFCFWLGTHEAHRGYEKDSWKKAKRDTSKINTPSYYPHSSEIVGDLADYSNEVEWFDKNIGECLAILAEKGLLENTIIIATADQGMPFPRVKGQVYEDDFHVPFVVRWDDKIKPGRVVTDFINFPDVAPTLLEVAGLPVHSQITGTSFLNVLLSEKSGRIDPERNYALIGKERHDLGRTSGDKLSVSYPVRAIRNDQFLYVRNFLPKRYPVGNPEYGYANVDGGPTKKYLLKLKPPHNDSVYFLQSFGKRPGEQLFDMKNDPDCIHNLAEEKAFREIKKKLYKQLEMELKAQGDPRILGYGDLFDYYPEANIPRQKKMYKGFKVDPIEEYILFVDSVKKQKGYNKGILKNLVEYQSYLKDLYNK